MALPRGPGDESDNEDLAIWSADTTLRKDEYFTRYLDGKPSPDDAEFEHELGKLLAKLYERQRHEAYGLLERIEGEMQLYDLRHNKDHISQGGGCAPETLKLYRAEFRKEYREQCQGFAEERERHISEYKNAQVIRDQMQNDERQETQERGL